MQARSTGKCILNEVSCSVVKEPYKSTYSTANNHWEECNLLRSAFLHLLTILFPYRQEPNVMITTILPQGDSSVDEIVMIWQLNYSRMCQLGMKYTVSLNLGDLWHNWLSTSKNFFWMQSLSTPKRQCQCIWTVKTFYIWPLWLENKS